MAKAAEKKKKVDDIIIGKKNIYIFLAGLIGIVIAFILMAQPPVDGFLSRTLAPVILVAVYLVVIPAAILVKDKAIEK